MIWVPSVGAGAVAASPSLGFVPVPLLLLCTRVYDLRSCGFSFCRCGPRGQGYVPKAGGEEPAWQRQPESRGRAQAGRAGGAPGPGQGAAEPAGAWRRRRLRGGVCELRQPAAGLGAEAAGGAGGRVRRALERGRRRRGDEPGLATVARSRPPIHSGGPERQPLRSDRGYSSGQGGEAPPLETLE